MHNKAKKWWDEIRESGRKGQLGLAVGTETDKSVTFGILVWYFQKQQIQSSLLWSKY